MKKLIAVGMIAMMILGACQSKEAQEEAARQKALADATREQLTEAVNDRDELLSLVNDISEGMEQIKALENILTVTNGTPESADKRQQILDDIAAIQKAMQQNREKLAELEKKLSSSNLANANLKKTIETLNVQIDSQAQEIASLKNNLVQANQTINELDAKVDTLKQEVSEVTAAKELAEQQSTKLANELNTCFYAVGTKSELKDHDIIETGFLRKTKLMEGDFDQTFFVRADKRTLTTIQLHSKKAEVMTKQPESSYTITDDGTQKVLTITNPKEFWSRSNFLVIKVD